MPRQEHTSPAGRRGDRFLSAYRIVCTDEHRAGRLVACEGPAPAPAITGRLRDHRNTRGRYYEERHLEEWVSREPAALFAGRPVLVLASQNYAHLGEKLDLLLVDAAGHFHVLELKAERVASNGGVTPDQIQGQMNRYLGFLRRELASFPACLGGYYARFTAAFHGRSRELAADLRVAFADTPAPAADAGAVLCPTFVTEGFDEYAVNYFGTRPRGPAGWRGSCTTARFSTKTWP